MNRSITFILVALLLTLLIISRVVASGVSFTKHIVDGEFDGANAVMAADVDGDGDLDILGAAYDGEDIAWWANNGDGSVWTKHTVDANFSYASSVYATDIDRDGDVDILGAALNVDGVTWWANNGNGSSWTEHSIGGELEAPKDLHAVDIDQDGDMDVVSAGLAGPVTWWANNGNGSSWKKHALEQAFDAAWAVYAADLDSDGDPDILAAGDVGDSGAVVWWQNNGQSWTKHVINADFSGARSVHAADVDGDGDMDILGAAASIDDMTWWANNGNGTAWTEHTIDGRFIGANSVYATDIDNDGDLDVLGTDGVATSDFTWWENTAGNGSSWDKHAQSGSYKVTHGVYAADMDGDNDFDVLAVAYFEHDIAWWENGMTPSTPGPTATKTSTPIATPISTSTPRPTSTSINTPTSTHTPNTGPPTPTSVPTHTPVPGTGDDYESDDSCNQASTILTDGTVQAHTFHTPGDYDWIAFEVTANTEYIIEALTPADSRADVAMELYDGCNTLPTGAQDYAFSPNVRLQFKAPATASGTYYLQLTNSAPEVAGSDVAYDLSVRGLASEATPGALILVAGRLNSNDSLQRNIHNVTNEVYRLFLANGYSSDRIYYLATDLNIDVDGDQASDVNGSPSRQKLELAITQWAADKVGPERALTLYLMDHGDIDSLYLNGPSQTVSPDDLDSWLDQLETAVPGVRVNVIVEACHSGSFIDLSNSVSQPGRVVMASTGTYPLAHASEEGAVFSDALVNALGRGMSLYGAFSEARLVSMAAHPDQTPWLDDNGDGVPNGDADGNEAQRRGFTYAGTFPPEQWPPYIMRADGPTEIVNGDGIIEAEVRDDQGVLSVSAEIYKPSYTPPNPEGAEEMVLETVPTIQLQLDPNRDGVYRGLYESFDEAGEYRIVVHAVDTQGLKARPKAVQVVNGDKAGWQLYLPVIIR